MDQVKELNRRREELFELDFETKRRYERRREIIDKEAKRKEKTLEEEMKKRRKKLQEK